MERGSKPDAVPRLLSARIAHWAQTRPDQLAVALALESDGQPGLTYAQLYVRASLLAECLLALGAGGKPVLLIATPGVQFAIGFVACLLSGAIAVPVPPNQRNRGMDRIATIALDALPVAILTNQHDLGLAAAVGIPEERLIVIDKPTEPGYYSAAQIDEHKPALIQYTSGSTANPKGVVITNGALTANLEMIREGFGLHAKSSICTWLPLFHDMGLIGQLLAAFHLGIPCRLMAPLAFLQRPERWLRAVSEHRITMTGAPNFAFDLCVRRRDGMKLDEIDLSCLETLFCGAEPVRARTLARFSQAFAPLGLKRSALTPCYGLAEATVYVSAKRFGSDVVARAPSGGAIDLVSCGPPASDETVVIVDPERSHPVADGAVGEIWIAGPNVATRYWRNSASPSETFGAQTSPPHPKGPFLRTGDFGFMIAGELHPSGRLKDLIIHQGQNIHPEDLEASILESHPALGGLCAVFGIERDDIGEQLVAVCETARGTRNFDERATFLAARDIIADQYGLRLSELVLARPGSLPRTTSGKIQRSQCRSGYLQRQFTMPVPNIVD